MRRNRHELLSQFISTISDWFLELYLGWWLRRFWSLLHQKNLSCEHTQLDIDDNTGKPQIILAHNKSKVGVDHFDQRCGTNITRRCTLRWLRCVFQCFIDVAAFNAFLPWRTVTGKQSAKRRQFFKMLGAVQSFVVVNLTRVDTSPWLQIHQQHHQQLLSLVARLPSVARPVLIPCA